jgi:XTP/dITP diphosphohydrolase
MKKIKKIIIGTNNIGKYREICDLLPKSIKKYSPKEFNLLTPKESGKNFKENALLKARFFSKKTNLICISDDSGLEINILKDKPGIYSARWAGEKNNFNLAIKKIYRKMSKFKKNWKKNNLARFVCCLAIFYPDGKFQIAGGSIKGEISIKKKGINGFGYDPIFIPDNQKKTFAEMSLKEKNKISHRKIAITKLKSFLF